MKFILSVTVVLVVSHLAFGAYVYKLAHNDAKTKYEKGLVDCNNSYQNELELKEQYSYLFNQCQILLKGPN